MTDGDQDAAAPTDLDEGLVHLRRRIHDQEQRLSEHKQHLTALREDVDRLLARLNAYRHGDPPRPPI
ncbi:hypothetical protein [Actinosynnema sp. ALI-1.44]|uniref:hypothetical protein n=1 Tax=Actinosynnema sp. ALI-1.44 TaxID=1933779 RepID=UPI001177F7B7|nr:hypothetical protein [Actinosynnema sp. ALI-1.44]